MNGSLRHNSTQIVYQEMAYEPSNVVDINVLCPNQQVPIQSELGNQERKSTAHISKSKTKPTHLHRLHRLHSKVCSDVQPPLLHPLWILVSLTLVKMNAYPMHNWSTVMVYDKQEVPDVTVDSRYIGQWEYMLSMSEALGSESKTSKEILKK